MKKFPVLALNCGVQCSSWGKVGSDSTVALLLKDSPGFVLNEEETYAELWMGTHPSFPCKVRNQNEEDVDFGEWVKRNPAAMGPLVCDKFNNHFPYLFKVLSINKALSIQAHPTKEMAQKLFEEQPKIYKDPNHKPEMAIALTKFEALCGFRPINEILSFFNDVDELFTVVGQAAVDGLINAEVASGKHNKASAVQYALKEVVTCLMKCDEAIISEQLSKLVHRLEECHENGQCTKSFVGYLFLRTHSQFPGDVGCFFVYFLNHMVLEPFEAIFLGPNVPHAYLSGDIVECMSSSNNVVRAGLTPKFKDVELLITMLDYSPRTTEERKFYPISPSDETNVSIYNPPVDDFTVKKIKIDSQLGEYCLKPLDGPSIVLFLSGRGEYTERKLFSKGTVVFVPYQETLHLENIDKEEEVLLFQAYCDLV